MYKETVESILKYEGLNTESVLYRYTNAHHIIKKDNGETFVKANLEPQEMVVDHYGNGHLTMASEIGKGLAFTLSKDSIFKTSDKACIRLKLGDVLSQGGALYQDQSSGEPNSWFLTIPEGEVKVQINKN
jgi:hypothetical protein